MDATRVANPIAVVDVESTCWDPRIGAPPQTGEIIEVGVCLLDPDEHRIYSPRSFAVLPRFSSISAFCVDLTGWTMGKLLQAGALPADEAFPLVRQHIAGCAVWASFGDYDLKQFERDCARTGIPSPWRGVQHLNVKALAAVTEPRRRSRSLGESLRHAGLAFAGTPHRGLDDAINVARLLHKLLRLDAVDCAVEDTLASGEDQK